MALCLLCAPPSRAAALAAASPAEGRESFVRNAGASADFAGEVRGLLDAALPGIILRDLAGYGYTLLIKDHVTQDRPDLPADLDFTGGLHEWGPLGDSIVVAQRIKSRASGELMPSRIWRNAVLHESGHALDRILGATESEKYQAAWKADYARIPGRLKRERLPEGLRNDFYYFLRPGRDGLLALARQETFAEAFDILLRGEGSSFNHSRFTRYFPRTMKAARELIERRYGLKL